MGGQYEVNDGATKKYYSIAGMMVAMNDGTGLQYLLTDHLGSTVAVTNASGTLTSQQRYLPFGAARTIPNSPLLGTDFTYTGQRKLDDGMGGIMDYKARFYSVGLGRFLQPDTIIPDQFNPQSWNRFSYVMNNPITYRDSSGHCIDGVSTVACLIVAGAIAGAVVGAGLYIWSESQQADGFDIREDWKDVAVAAGTGLVAGALIMTPGATSVGVSLAASLVSDHAVNIITDRDFSRSKHLQTGVIGLGAGFVAGYAVPGLMSATGATLTAGEQALLKGLGAFNFVLGLHVLNDRRCMVMRLECNINPEGEMIDAVTAGIGEGAGTLAGTVLKPAGETASELTGGAVSATIETASNIITQNLNQSSGDVICRRTICMK